MGAVSSSANFCPLGFTGSKKYVKVLSVPPRRLTAVRKALKAATAATREAADWWGGRTYLHLFREELQKIGLDYVDEYESRRYKSIRVVEKTTESR